MIWHRHSAPVERVDSGGPRGVLMQGDALSLDLSAFYGRVKCVYLDPPYFTGNRFQFRMRLGEEGWRTGKPTLSLPAYNDFSSGDEAAYLAFLEDAIRLAHKLLSASGSFFLHLDWRMQAHARLLCDSIFGPEHFKNDIIWSYQTGGRSLKYFSRKHDNILFYAKGKAHFFDITAVPSAKKRERSNHLKRHVDAKGRSYRSITTGGKTYVYYDDEPAYPDDVWSDVSQMQQKDPQRTGYATQKPLALLERIILCATRPGDLVADFFCGSGTTLSAAAEHGREFLGVDASRHAFSVSRKRMAHAQLTSYAPLSQAPAMLDAGLTPGIGYYAVRLNAYTLSSRDEERQGLELNDLDHVDQWYAGLIVGDTFVVYDSAGRSKITPNLPRILEVPLLRGTPGVLVVDIWGNRTLWVPA